MNSHKSPVAFFGFNRPDCTKIVFEEIRRYRPHQLFLVADGPRSTVPTDAIRCQAVREIMRSVDWKCDVETNYADTNLGCKRRMSSGIEWVFSRVEEAIFLEDDCVPCPDFFEFCSELLVHYRDNPQVMHISGTNFQRGQWRGDGTYYFSNYPHVWGWASWRKAWQSYDVEMRSWPQSRKGEWLSNAFSKPLEREYWTTILNLVHAGKIDTWDYQWHYAFWRRDGIGIIPNVNLVTNIGAGPEATHTKGEVGALAVPTGTLGELRHPHEIGIDRVADEFTFATRFGGDDRLREKHPIARFRRQLSRLKRFLKRKI